MIHVLFVIGFAYCAVIVRVLSTLESRVWSLLNPLEIV
jgi:hypothetical protein